MSLTPVASTQPAGAHRRAARGPSQTRDRARTFAEAPHGADRACVTQVKPACSNHGPTSRLLKSRPRSPGRGRGPRPRGSASPAPRCALAMASGAGRWTGVDPDRMVPPADCGHRHGAPHPGDRRAVREHELRRLVNPPRREDGGAYSCAPAGECRSEVEVVQAQFAAIRTTPRRHLLEQQQIGICRGPGRPDERIAPSISRPNSMLNESRGSRRRLTCGSRRARGPGALVVPRALRIEKVRRVHAESVSAAAAQTAAASIDEAGCGPAPVGRPAPGVEHGWRCGRSATAAPPADHHTGLARAGVE